MRYERENLLAGPLSLMRQRGGLDRGEMICGKQKEFSKHSLGEVRN